MGKPEIKFKLVDGEPVCTEADCPRFQLLDAYCGYIQCGGTPEKGWIEGEQISADRREGSRPPVCIPGLRQQRDEFKIILDKVNLWVGKMGASSGLIRIHAINEIADILMGSVPDYPILIEPVHDGDDHYYIAFHPDFGLSACSAPGRTPQLAIEALDDVRRGLIKLMREQGDEIPEPSVHASLKHVEEPSDG